MSNSLRPHGLYVAHQAPPSMGFPRQEYWSELPLPSPGDLPNPGIEPASPASQADSLPLSHLDKFIIKCQKIKLSLDVQPSKVE